MHPSDYSNGKSVAPSVIRVNPARTGTTKAHHHQSVLSNPRTFSKLPPSPSPSLPSTPGGIRLDNQFSTRHYPPPSCSTITRAILYDSPSNNAKVLQSPDTFFSFFFFNLTYSRWTSSLPSCLWSLRILPSLPGSRLAFLYRDASSALLQLVNQWVNFTYSRSHAFRYERKSTNPTLVRIELTTSALAGVQVTY